MACFHGSGAGEVYAAARRVSTLAWVRMGRSSHGRGDLGLTVDPARCGAAARRTGRAPQPARERVPAEAGEQRLPSSRGPEQLVGLRRRSGWESRHRSKEPVRRSVAVRRPPRAGQLPPPPQVFPGPLEYNPPAGKAGELVAELFKDPDRQVERAVENFRKLVETGGLGPA